MNKSTKFVLSITALVLMAYGYNYSYNYTPTGAGVISDFVTGMGVIFLGAVFFLPTIIANKRNHHHKTPILLTNLFFGWSGVGWVVALIWSTMPVTGNVVIEQ